MEDLKPFMVQVAAQQRSMAKSLEVPLARYAEAQSRLIMTPELTRAMERLRTASRVHLELPDEDGLDRLARLIDDGEISPDTVSAAETGLAGEAELSEAIEDAAEHLHASRPWISRARSRQIVMVWVWLMWTAAAATIVLTSPAEVGAVLGMSGVATADKGAAGAGKLFDKFRPPDEERTVSPQVDD